MTKDNWIKAFCAEYLCDDGCLIGDPCKHCVSKAERIYEYHQSQIKYAIEKTNKRWGERCRKLKRKPSLLDIVVPAFSAEARNRRDIKYYNKALSDLLEDKK